MAVAQQSGLPPAQQSSTAPSTAATTSSRWSQFTGCFNWDTAKKVAAVVLACGAIAAATYFGGPYASQFLNLNAMTGYGVVGAASTTLVATLEAIRRFVTRPAATTGTAQTAGAPTGTDSTAPGAAAGTADQQQQAGM